MLERFRLTQDEIGVKIRAWPEQPETEMAKLEEQRERERRGRLAGARPSTPNGAWPGDGI